METQFVCQKIMAKKVILQQCAQPQVIYLSLAMFLWTMFQHVQTFHTEHYSLIYILQHMPHSLELIQLCGFFFMNKALVNGSSIYWPIFNSI